MDWWRIVCCAAAGYLLGSCNGAIVVSHTCMHDDIRKKGSGNAGLTNFLRNFGGWATLLVVLMDMGKVVLACLLGRWLLFLIIVFATHYVSLGSILAATAYAVLFVIFFPGQPWIWSIAIAMAVLAIFMHRSNIARLLHGTETKTYLLKSKKK